MRGHETLGLRVWYTFEYKYTVLNIAAYFAKLCFRDSVALIVGRAACCGGYGKQTYAEQSDGF